MLLLFRLNFLSINKNVRINGAITGTEIRLLDNEDEQLGVVTVAQALVMAQEAGLDLVEIAPKANPPVCKVMDFGKYIYRQQKLEQKQKNKNPKNEIKGVRLGIATSPHDLEIKANQAKKFLSKGAKVKIMLMFHGREISRKELGRVKIAEFLKYLDGECQVEQGIISQGKLMSMLVKPNN